MLKIENELCPLYEIIPYLPARLGGVLRLFCVKNESLASLVTELRLRADGAFSLSLSDENIFVDSSGEVSQSFIRCTDDEIHNCVSLLCDSSFHSHTEEMRLGYISTTGPYRAGIAPRFSLGGGLWGAGSVCIRIPHDFTGCCEELLGQCGVCSMLIYSPPGVGKTTLLRDIVRVCGKSLRTVVCDTRGELSVRNKPPLADYITGMEKGAAISLATRTLSPQLLICDEIGGGDEAAAVLEAQNTGVPLIATAHGDSYGGLMNRPNIKILHENGIFSHYVKLSRQGKKYAFDIEDGRV